MITINEFSKYDNNKRGEVVFQQGKYIGVRYIKNYAVNLYSVNDFFVEVWYIRNENKIEKIEILENETTLNLYIEYMNKLK